LKESEDGQLLKTKKLINFIKFFNFLVVRSCPSSLSFNEYIYKQKQNKTKRQLSSGLAKYKVARPGGS